MSPGLQAVVVGIVAAAAALWVVWSILLPRSLRRAVSARLGKAPKSGGCDRCGG